MATFTKLGGFVGLLLEWRRCCCCCAWIVTFFIDMVGLLALKTETLNMAEEWRYNVRRTQMTRHR